MALLAALEPAAARADGEQVPEGTLPQLAHATSQAPSTVAEWYREARLIDPDLVGLARIGGDVWCAIGADSATVQATIRCLTPDGIETTPEAWHEQRQQQRAESRGAMSGDLDHHLRHLTTSEATEATLWARHDVPIREGGAEELDRVAADYRSRQQALIDVCHSLEGCSAQAVVDGPLVHIAASPDALRALARHSLVGAIDYMDPNRIIEPGQGPPPAFEETMECVRIDEADVLYTADGSGTIITVVEGGEPPADALALIPNYAGSNCTGLGSPVHDHAAYVLSINQGDSGGLRAIDGSAVGADVLIGGMAPECFPCSIHADCRNNFCNFATGRCNYSYSQRQMLGLEWAVQQGSDVINYSQQASSPYCNTDAPSSYDDISRYIDYLATQMPYPVVVPIAGNYGANRVVAAAPYNGLLVGGVDHNGSTDRSNHTIWNNTSCTVNTFDNGWGAHGRNRLSLDSLELPHLVAPAWEVAYLAPRVGGGVDWFAGWGTSLAAPHVSGIAARIFDLNPSLLAYPEAVRAILIASASEDVDGVALSLNDTVDDRDGAGEVDAYEAERVAMGNQNCWGSTGSPCGMRGVNWGPLVSADFSAAGYYHDQDVYFRPTSGNTVRIALHWMNNATCTPSTLSCSGDPVSPMTLGLWLWKRNPSTGGWTLQALSLQPNPEDNYLYIQAAITPYDTYRIRFNYPGLVTGRSTYYGLSWMTR